MSVRILKISMLLMAAGLLMGCGQNGAPAGQGSAGAVPITAEQDKPGAQLWAENCSRCHNMRPPQSFSAAQWAAIVQHMRLRADLTGVEARKIKEFLQAGA